VRVGLALLETMGALPCNVAGMTQNLMMVMMPHPTQPKVKAMTLCMMLLKTAPTCVGMPHLDCNKGFSLF
jgi:hypothetical protein